MLAEASGLVPLVPRTAAWAVSMDASVREKRKTSISTMRFSLRVMLFLFILAVDILKAWVGRICLAQEVCQK